ncbi:hypothetical protein [Pseudonocardia sp.]|uniref:hypothetical protein n=1 Tax=Pseudonocardia sp. TaxID=60912 RepID=UPI003D114E68
MADEKIPEAADARPEQAPATPPIERRDAPFVPPAPAGPVGPPGAVPGYLPLDDVITTSEPAVPAGFAAPDSDAASRRPDALLLVFGILTLVAAVATFVGVTLDLGAVDPRWVLAGGAAAVGTWLLVSGLRQRRRST